MGAVKESYKECLGCYENVQGHCGGCPVALLCIDTTIAADAYYDSLAERQLEIMAEEMEASYEAELQGNGR